jgi:Pyruvate/2-oxoacid:ferredoxin oxidoreductase delta subunit
MADFVYAIDEKTCIECGQCRRYCPIPGAIIINSDYQHTVVADLCTGCGICAAFCPIPNVLFRVAKQQSDAVLEPLSGEFLAALRRVVWRSRWQYHEHPVMKPVTGQAREELKSFLYAYRQGIRKIAAVRQASELPLLRRRVRV